MKLKKHRILFLSLLILCIFLIGLISQNFIYSSLKNIQKRAYQARFSEQTPGQLEQEIIQLKQEEAEIAVLREENRVLREALDFQLAQENKLVFVNVIGKRTEMGINWFLLDQGKNQGIEEGLAVIDNQGNFLGKIVKVESNVAFAQSIFSQQSSVAADIIKDKSSNQDIIQTTSGLVEGRYGLTAVMKYIPLNKEINKDQWIITSGLEEKIKRGLIIGQVNEIIKKPNAVFQEIIIKPLNTLEQSRIVAIVLVEQNNIEQE